jgi:outer membrane autotransporter protein
MKPVRLRGTLLATSSALALIVGIGGSARAVPPSCAVNNTFAGLPNTTAINCISFNDGASHTGDVTNANNGTITAVHPYPPVHPGTSTGISVVRPGTTLNGNIINNGSISAPQYGINVGAGATIGNIQGAGASLVGSITNNGTITGGGGGGIIVRQSSMTGSITNGVNGSINTTNVGIVVTGVSGTLASVGGSITNSGTLTIANNDGMFVQFATVGGSISNAGSISVGNGSAGIVASRGSVAGSVTNSSTINAHAVGIDVKGESVGGSVANSGGTINAQNGIGATGITGLPVLIAGNVVNSGTINASAGTGIAIFAFKGGATISGGISNSGTINSTAGNGIGLYGAVVNGDLSNTNNSTIKAQGGAGILISATTTAFGASSVKGSVINQGSITAKTGIMVAGGAVITGGITNSGSLTGTGGKAIDVTGEGAAMVINQQGGTITGDILLSGLGDTVNVTGGAIAGNITGTGASGTVNFALGAGNTFSYANAISGVAAVNVTSGTLFDNNSIAATLVSINGGALAPGQPGTAGTLSVTGNLVFASAAAYLITINGANAGKTAVTGTAGPGGASVKIASGSTINFGQTYTILTATGGVSGTFNPIVTFGNLTGTLTYDAHDVFLSFNGGSSKITPLLPPGSPQNVLNVAGALDSFLATGGTPPPGFLNLFNLTPQQLVNVLTLLSGEAGTGAQESGFQLMSSFLALLTGPAGGTGNGGGPAMPFAPERAQAFPSDVALAYASVLKALPKATPRWTAWGAAFGGSNRVSGDPTGVGSHDLTARAGAVAAGMDYHVSRDTIVGLSLAGGGTSWGLSAGLGGGRSDAFLAGLYGSQRWNQAYLSGALTYASYWMSTNRTITVAGTDTLNASFNAWNFGGRLEGGFVAWSMPFRVIPYAAVQAQRFRSPAYSESGSLGAPDPFALSYAAQTATVVRSELGSRFDQIFAQADGSSVDLFGRAAWAHDWQSNPNLTATFIGLPAATFVVNGAAPPKDLALLTSGAEWRLRSGWSFMGKFDGEFAQGSRTYTGTANVSYTW